MPTEQAEVRTCRSLYGLTVRAGASVRMPCKELHTTHLPDADEIGIRNTARGRNQWKVGCVTVEAFGQRRKSVILNDGAHPGHDLSCTRAPGCRSDIVLLILREGLPGFVRNQRWMGLLGSAE